MPAAFPADHDDHDGRAAGRAAAGLGHGVGAEFRRPLGITIVGGLIFSQALTLFTTPVVYLYMDRLRLRSSRRAQTLPGTIAPAGSQAD